MTPTYQGRIAAQKAGESTITALVRDGDSIEMAFDLDRKTSAMAFDLTVAAKPGTELAGSLRGFQRRRSLFQGLGGDGPLAAWASIPMARSVRDGFRRASSRPGTRTCRASRRPSRRRSSCGSWTSSSRTWRRMTSTAGWRSDEPRRRAIGRHSTPRSWAEGPRWQGVRSVVPRRGGAAQAREEGLRGHARRRQGGRRHRDPPDRRALRQG